MATVVVVVVVVVVEVVVVAFAVVFFVEVVEYLIAAEQGPAVTSILSRPMSPSFPVPSSPLKLICNTKSTY